MWNRLNRSYAKDSKNLAITKTSEPWKLKVDLFANFAQFIYDDVNPENPVGAPRTSGGKLVPTTDAWLLAWQVGARFTFPNNLYAQLAPTLYNYTGNGDTFNGHFVGGNPALSNSDSAQHEPVGYQQPSGFRYADGDRLENRGTPGPHLWRLCF